jgi:hypothetical protein
LDTGFIELLYSPLGTTSNYSVITILHTLQITTVPAETYCEVQDGSVEMLMYSYMPLLHLFYYNYYYFMSLQPFVGTWPLLQFLNLFTVGRTPWTGDQPVARPLPTHRTNAHNTDMHALSGVPTHDPSVRASEDCS